MKSGAYIVINPTEALVSIDVNSGRSTKERNIEETALRTNIEAAEEIARQLRLRDLAGLIVIDFIDMEVHRNQGKVERALKEAMRPDRARIQIGRISPFGLLELSRQRLRPSLIETSSEPCPYCQGTGIRRSTDTTAVEVIRAVEEEGMRKPNGEITVYRARPASPCSFSTTNAILWPISKKKYGLTATFESDDTLIPPAIRMEREDEGDVTNKAKQSEVGSSYGSEDSGGKRRRRRRAGGGADAMKAEITMGEENEAAASEELVGNVADISASDNDDEQQAGGDFDEKILPVVAAVADDGAGRRRHRRGEDNAGIADTKEEAADGDGAPTEPALPIAQETPKQLAAPEIPEDPEINALDKGGARGVFHR